MPDPCVSPFPWHQKLPTKLQTPFWPRVVKAEAAAMLLPLLPVAEHFPSRSRALLSTLLPSQAPSLNTSSTPANPGVPPSLLTHSHHCYFSAFWGLR